MRGLAVFWAILLCSLVIGAGVLQYLGPPVAAVHDTDRIGPRAFDQALAEQDPDQPTAMLPRIARDGRRPMIYYAAPPPAPSGSVRIAILVDGIGLSQSDSRRAMEQLPPAVSLAFSPYAADPVPLEDEARRLGHEYLVSIPLEPDNAPLNDEGVHALLTSATQARNAANLRWALSRITGYVGATSALDGLDGAAFQRSPDQFALLQDQINQRGLLFIDARPGAAPPSRVAGRSVDVLIDAPDDAASIDAKLAALLATARAHGSALGLAGPLRPVSLQHLSAWLAQLPSQQVKLVPVSALVN